MYNTSAMGYIWDENKNAANYRKHGIHFEEAIVVFERPYLTLTDDRYDYDEIREVSIGEVGPGNVLVVVHTERGHDIRIISARKATSRERRRYHEYLERTLS